MDNFNALSQPERYRIMQAVNTLCANNPDVIKQLEKLAEIKREDGLVWKILKSKVS
jgi:hypothetical protein